MIYFSLASHLISLGTRAQNEAKLKTKQKNTQSANTHFLTNQSK